MITKYSIDLRQFNNGESEKITFPTFDQCLMYGIHKLKAAMNNETCIIRAVLIEDAFGRRIVVTPTDEEVGHVEREDTHIVKKISLVDLQDVNIRLHHDDEEGTTQIFL